MLFREKTNHCLLDGLRMVFGLQDLIIQFNLTRGCIIQI